MEWKVPVWCSNFVSIILPDVKCEFFETCRRRGSWWRSVIVPESVIRVPEACQTPKEGLRKRGDAF
jgi:hypothetical protein